MQRFNAKTLLIAIVVIFVGGYFGIKALQNTEYGDKLGLTQKTKESVTISKVTLPDAPPNIESTAPPVAMPTDALANLKSTQIRYQVWAWNSQMGMFFSNGGAETTKGSIMEKRGVNLKFIRNDDVPQMQASLVQFAKSYASNPNTQEGCQFVSIMGDGAAAFLAGVNPELQKIGSEYIAQIIGTSGKSLGEDKLMGPKEWLKDPQKAKGSVVAGYLRDGDWNIAVMWAAANGIKVNPDEKTYDPDAMNWIAADTYIDASQKYINNYTEERPIARNGKISTIDGKKKIQVDAVVTWTPGDVMIVESKGGLVNIVTTNEYRSQMPNVVIGIKKFMQDNRPLVENMFAGFMEGSDQVKGYEAALNHAGQISQSIYKEANTSPEYWIKFYKGALVVDKSANEAVHCGGSRVHNLADNLQYFGLAPGTSDVYNTVYTTFGDIVKNMYPTLVPSYPDYAEVVDLSYLKNVAATYKESQITKADEVKYDTERGIQNTISKKNWNITFQVGSAEFTPQAYEQLEQIYAQSAIASGLQIRVSGHTDNTGSDDVNIPLSQQRANAVRQWLENKGGSAFKNRISVKGYGSTMPIADNYSETGRKQNRRVEILMGN